VLLTNTGINYILGEFDASIHELRPSVEFQLLREGRVDTVTAEFVATKPRFIFYRETTHANSGS